MRGGGAGVGRPSGPLCIISSVSCPTRGVSVGPFVASFKCGWGYSVAVLCMCVRELGETPGMVHTCLYQACVDGTDTQFSLRSHLSLDVFRLAVS